MNRPYELIQMREITKNYYSLRLMTGSVQIDLRIRTSRGNVLMVGKPERVFFTDEAWRAIIQEASEVCKSLYEATDNE